MTATNQAPATSGDQQARRDACQIAADTLRALPLLLTQEQQASGLTWDEFADTSGFGRHLLRKWRRGEPTTTANAIRILDWIAKGGSA